MAPWTPDNNQVKPSEFVGRRIFGKSSDEVSSIELTPNMFFDSRLNEDLSLDRLGENKVNKEVVKQLTPLCDSAAQNMSPPQTFFGWAAIQLKNMTRAKVFPDPLTLERDKVENSYHALIDRSSVRNKDAAFFFSRSLLWDFKEKGQMVEPIRPVTDSALVPPSPSAPADPL